MSKKHFQKLAYELMLARPVAADFDSAQAYEAAHNQWCHCVNAVTDACAQSNSLFDRSRFRAACEAESYAPGMHGR